MTSHSIIIRHPVLDPAPSKDTLTGCAHPASGIRTYLSGSTIWAPAQGWPQVIRPALQVRPITQAARPKPGGSR